MLLRNTGKSTQKLFTFDGDEQVKQTLFQLPKLCEHVIIWFKVKQQHLRMKVVLF